MDLEYFMTFTLFSFHINNEKNVHKNVAALVFLHFAPDNYT